MKFRVLTVTLALVVAGGASAAGAADSEAAANRRGYELLRRGDVDGAIRVFEQNVQAYPRSANVYDSLAEAYEKAGDTPKAIENYRKAVALNPRAKNARYAVARLTGERARLRPSVLFHVAGGIVGLLSGTAAIVLRKGSRRHEVAGRIFVVAMLCMGASGAAIAFLDPAGETINVLMGLLACYLVVTAWLTARRRGAAGNGERLAAIAALALGLALVRYGVAVARSPTGPTDGIPAAVYFVFSAVAFLAAAGDVRMLARGGISGPPRIARHLWRMCTALFIAAGSFFLGQPQVFPDALRDSAGLRAIPVLLVIAAMAFWMVRVRVARPLPA
jgi:tetratricopeptide (TPR) repeat protein